MVPVIPFEVICPDSRSKQRNESTTRYIGVAFILPGRMIHCIEFIWYIMTSGNFGDIVTVMSMFPNRFLALQPISQSYMYMDGLRSAN